MLGIILVAAAISLAMGFAWAVQFRTRNASWVDAIWTFSSGLGGAACALLATGAPLWRRCMIAALAIAWCGRLGAFILRRAASGHEDPRYTDLRCQWGTGYQLRMFAFLQLQALTAFLLAIAIRCAAANPAPRLRLLDIAALAVLLAAVLGETLADRQMHRFRQNPANRGKICDTGLWNWSRHPNYFFEWLGWTGYVLFAIDPGFHYLWGWASLIGPAMMYWLLVHVSGIPPVETAMAKSRGPAFAVYQRRTSAFFPWPPKHPGTPV